MDSKQAEHIIAKLREKQGNFLQSALGSAGDLIYGRPGYPKNVAQSAATNAVGWPSPSVRTGYDSRLRVRGTPTPTPTHTKGNLSLGRMQVGGSKPPKKARRAKADQAYRAYNQVQELHDPKGGTPSPWHFEGKPTGEYKPQLAIPTPPVTAPPPGGFASPKPRQKQGMSVVEGMQEQLQKQLRNAAMRDILGTALLGAGVAGTVRGGQGLWNLINRSSNKLRNRPGIAPLPVPYRPTFKDEEEEKEGSEKQAISASLLSKALGSATTRYTAGKIPWKRILQFIRKAGAREPKLFKGFPKKPSMGMLNQRKISLGTLPSPSLRSRIPSGVPIKPTGGSPALRRGQTPGSKQMAYDGPMLGEYASPGLYPGRATRGGYANQGYKSGMDKQSFDMPKPRPTQKGGLWWYMPSMLGAAGAGVVGGWKLIDTILDRRRRKEIEDEVDESQRSFRSALTSQYKEGSDSELGGALDELYAKLQKSADLNPATWFSPDTKGKAMGAYATYAIPSALLGYMVVKGLADKGSRAKILEKAQRRRALKQQRSRPAELYAVPTPIEEEEE